MKRRHLLLLAPVAGLSACGNPPPPVPAGPDIAYSYLPQLRLNVASVDIDPEDPSSGPNDLGRMMSPSAAEAVRVMGRDRVAAFGNQNTARFVVSRASIAMERLPRQGGLFSGDPGERLVCVLAARLEIRDGNQRRLGFVEAEVRRTAPAESTNASRNSVASSLLRRSAFDLNTEFEFQVRRGLRDFLVEGDRAAPPPPGAVQREQL
ncbi:hypothetical protein EOD42_02400 [Rhodovarius crocodyli]|uniref:Lipoprotein n=1 Tax=Rhodovarius crocodyli TaxID=1979269 RepID=A0A437MMV7_9PROT|nr:hypothetical protein [Rhodovarius crocodyli]RVT98981.1 hypothetical protein EOD42_02400 [Rhodovarius crocodyli]